MLSEVAISLLEIENNVTLREIIHVKRGNFLFVMYIMLPTSNKLSLTSAFGVIAEGCRKLQEVARQVGNLSMPMVNLFVIQKW